MIAIKKDFQKVIGEIRKHRNVTNNINSQFPKPMMTGGQMEKKEATVNCGGEWSTTEKTLELAEIVMADAGFIGFLKRHGASANLEKNNFGTYQIRIHF